MTDNDVKEDSNVQQNKASASNFVQIFVVYIEMISASDLVKADTFGKSDPYCKVLALDQTFTTKTIMKDLNPVWNEKTQFCLFENPKKLKFEVWDWEKRSTHDAIGDIELDVESFFDKNHPGFEGNLTLKNVKRGELKVKVYGRKLLPVALENRATELQAETASQLAIINDKNKEIAKIKQINANLNKDNQQLTNQNSQLNDKKNALEGTLEELRNTEMSLRVDIDRLSGIVEGMSEALNEEKLSASKITNELKDTQQRFTSSVNENKALKSEVDNINRELNVNRTDYETDKQEILRLRA